MPATVTVDATELDRLMARLIRTGRKRMPTLIREVGRTYANNAASGTPVMRKGTRRKWFQTAGGKWVTWKNGQKVKGRGFAKSGWFRALEGLNQRTESALKGGRWHSVGIWQTNKSNDMPGITIGNAVDYIVKLNTSGAGKTGRKARFHETALVRCRNKLRERLRYFLTGVRRTSRGKV